MGWLIWLFPVFCTVHNMEEALTLPDYAQAREKNILPEKRVFIGFAVFLTILAYAVTGFYAFNQARIFGNLYFGYVGAMLINAFVPHITASIAARKPVPGFFTAIINVAVFGYILIHSVLHRIISLKTLFYSTLAVGGMLLLLLMFGFKLVKSSAQK